MKKIDFMLTAFRDGFQSVFGARVFSSDFLPVVEEAAAAGITHFEAGGGALFQAAYFYSNEDAFRVMDNFRRIVGNSANLQTLARGINVVGLDSQPRDIIKLHAQLMKKHGITTTERREQPPLQRDLHCGSGPEARNHRHHDGTAPGVCRPYRGVL